MQNTTTTNFKNQMKKIILIGTLLLVTVAGVLYANGTFNTKSCCEDKTACDTKKTAETTNKAGAMSTCDNGCSEGTPCGCSGCEGECKAACVKAGHCVCGSDTKLSANTKTALKGAGTCKGACDQTAACTCEDCSGDCKAACEEAGTCVCK